MADTQTTNGRVSSLNSILCDILQGKDSYECGNSCKNLETLQARGSNEIGKNM